MPEIVEKIEETEPTISEDIGEKSKKYEDFTQADFKSHLEATVDITETKFDNKDSTFARMGCFTIIPKGHDSFHIPENCPILNVGQLTKDCLKQSKSRKLEEE